MTAPACMGGWCGKRAACSNYTTESRSEPVERLCIPGADGVGADIPIRIIRPVGSWEAASAPAFVSEWFDA